jgi:hypothetical protein
MPSKSPKTQLERVLELENTGLMEPGGAIVLHPGMMAMVIDAIELARLLADAGIKDANGVDGSIKGTRLDAVLAALICELHALNNGTASPGLQPNRMRLRADSGSQRSEHSHPIDHLLRYEAVGAYELLKMLGLKAKTEAMPFVLRAIGNRLSQSAIYDFRKSLADQEQLEYAMQFFANLVIKAPLPGAEAPAPDWMTKTAIKRRISDQLKSTADRSDEMSKIKKDARSRND